MLNRRLLAATAALALFGGGAFAQSIGPGVPIGPSSGSGSGGGGGGVPPTKVVTFSSSGTYTPTPGMVKVDVYLYAAGGGGGGGAQQVSTAAVSRRAGGGGGRASNFAQTFTAAQVQTSQVMPPAQAGPQA